MERRRLPKEELRDGMYVETYTVETYKLGEKVQAYRLIIEEGKTYYTIDGADWRMDSELVIDNWCETEETRRLNRESKLKELGIQ